MWQKWPRRMLRHKALIQAARVAFGFAGLSDEDEFERAESVRRGTQSVPLKAHASFDDFANTNARPAVGQVEQAEAVETGFSPSPDPASANPIQHAPAQTHVEASAPASPPASGADAELLNDIYCEGRRARATGVSRNEAVAKLRYLKHKEAAHQGWDDEDAQIKAMEAAQ